MTDDSNIVYRWEIDNVTAKHAAGKAESGEFIEGGFKWAAAVEKIAGNNVIFALRCAVDHNGPWKCEAEVDMRMLRRNGSFWQIVKNCFTFNDDCNCWQHIDNYTNNRWNNLIEPVFNIDEKVTIELIITIISSEGSIAQTTMFSAPNNMSNVILKIGDEKLHVFKELLSAHSPVFKTMFFGEFAEKGKEEVEMKNVVYKEFVGLLQLIYVRNVEITDRTVSHILKLADQFQIEHVVELCLKHLRQSKGIDVVKKLLLADKYNLASITDLCLESITSIADLTKHITSSPEYNNFSVDMKASICDRLAMLSIQKA